MTDQWEVIISVYAALVATGVFALEMRRWFESGVRLNLNVMSEAEMVGGSTRDSNTYLLLTVNNRGTSSTTITHMVIFKYYGWYARLRKRASFSAFVKGPGSMSGRDVPFVLDPGQQWQGLALYDDNLRTHLKSGKLYVGIVASHRRGAIIQRVKRPETVAENSVPGTPDQG